MEWSVKKERSKTAALEKRVAELEAALKRIAALDVDEYRRKNPKVNTASGEDYAALFGTCQGIALSTIGY